MDRSLGLSPIMVDPRLINFSQSWVSPNDYAAVMNQKGWFGDPLNVMIRDGQMVSFDNRRLDAALENKVDKVPVNIVDEESPYPKSTTGKSWNDAFDERLGRNGLGKYGASERPVIGKADGQARVARNRRDKVGC